jgi:hypothetical protein
MVCKAFKGPSSVPTEVRSKALHLTRSRSARLYPFVSNDFNVTALATTVYSGGSHAIETERVRFADVVARGGGLAVSPYVKATERVQSVNLPSLLRQQ